jgi:hypothetical protein
MNNTPETDALVPQFLNGGEIPDVFALCRKLERERDEAITRRMETIMQCELYEQERDEARDAIVGLENKWNIAVEMAAIAENERDILKEELINLEDQRDLAMKVLKRLEAQLSQKEQ